MFFADPSQSDPIPISFFKYNYGVGIRVVNEEEKFAAICDAGVIKLRIPENTEIDLSKIVPNKFIKAKVKVSEMSVYYDTQFHERNSAVLEELEILRYKLVKKKRNLYEKDHINNFRACGGGKPDGMQRNRITGGKHFRRSNVFTKLCYLAKYNVLAEHNVCTKFNIHTKLCDLSKSNIFTEHFIILRGNVPHKG